MTKIIGGDTIAQVGVFNSTVPNEGPKSIPLLLDFTAETSYRVDLSIQTANKVISFIQCVFIDNSLSNARLAIFCDTTRQTIVCPPKSQGYVPVLAGRPPVFLFESLGGAKVSIQFLNVPMPLGFWSVNAGGFSLDGNGFAQVAMPSLDALIGDTGSGSGLAVRVLGGSSGGGGKGLRLPANYNVKKFAHTFNNNLILQSPSPRFYVNAISLHVDASAYTAAPNGLVTVTVKQDVNGTGLIQEIIRLPSAAPAAPTQAQGPVEIATLVNLDFWSTVDAEALYLNLSHDVLGGSVRAIVAGGSGIIPV